MADLGRIKFEGVAPFDLPGLQNASANVVDRNVLMTLYAIVDGQGPAPVPLQVQMVPKVAHRLSIELGQTADQADAVERRG